MPIIADPQRRVVKLVRVRFIDGPQRELLAKVTEIGPQRGFNQSEAGREIELGMGDVIPLTRYQTTVDLAHKRTILNIIKSSVSSTPLPNPRPTRLSGAYRSSKLLSRFLRTRKERSPTSRSGTYSRSNRARQDRSNPSQWIRTNLMSDRTGPGVAPSARRCIRPRSLLGELPL